MIRRIDTEAAPKPFSNYAQATVVDPDAQLLFISGQVGADTAGRIGATPEEQHRLAWRNVLGILTAAGMDRTNIVDVHVYITDGAHIGLYRQVRDDVLQGHRAASTLLVVAGLADPKLLVEISVVAAAPA